MPSTFDPIPGARVFAHSNPPALACACLISSLEVFAAIPGMMKTLRGRSEDLTGYLEQLLVSSPSYLPPSIAGQHLDDTAKEPAFTIITPTLPLSARGSQLSLLFFPSAPPQPQPDKPTLMRRVFSRLVDFGVLGDEREPSVIRLAPSALYSSFEDCRRAAQAVDVVMAEERTKWRDERDRERQAMRPDVGSLPKPKHLPRRTPSL